MRNIINFGRIVINDDTFNKNKFYRTYKYKFYLDANHSVLINGIKGESHPHTWEFLIELRNTNGEFIKFSDIEATINRILSPYQNNYINEIKPFNNLNPTTENMAIYFKEIFEKKMCNQNWEILKLELSEAPNRTFIIKKESSVVI